MTHPDRIFLTVAEALAAIRIDFQHYPPQTELFIELAPRLLGPKALVARTPRSDDLLLASGNGLPPAAVSPQVLGERLCRALETATPHPETLADWCGRVFEAPAQPGRDPETGEPGIWIETGMETFVCRQCGRCCRRLDYHDALTETDYDQWVALDRTDILERVGVVRKGERITGFTLWMEPGTRRYAPVCPWLTPVPGSGAERWLCRIHDVKPEICRDYPGSRKHARMTGCIGFGDLRR